MNVAAIDKIIGRAEDLGCLAEVVSVLQEAEKLETQHLPPWALSAMQSAYVLARTTDRGTDAAVRDLLTTCATALALTWRTEIYTRAAADRVD